MGTRPQKWPRVHFDTAARAPVAYLQLDASLCPGRYSPKIAGLICRGLSPITRRPRLMPNKVSYDAVVVGCGPNGLAAAIRLAQEKLSVLVLEANDIIGGGSRSAELTLPGFTHDLCSAVHPLGIGSPFFRKLRLERYGLHWLQPEIPLAHPVEGEAAAVLQRSLEKTAEALGSDQTAYTRLMAPLVEQSDDLSGEF